MMVRVSDLQPRYIPGSNIIAVVINVRKIRSLDVVLIHSTVCTSTGPGTVCSLCTVVLRAVIATWLKASQNVEIVFDLNVLPWNMCACVHACVRWLFGWLID